MRTVNTWLTWLLCALALSGCATPALPPVPPSVIEAPRLRLPEPPAEVMLPREPNFRLRLLDFFCPSCTTPMPSSDSSAAPSK